MKVKDLPNEYTLTRFFLNSGQINITGRNGGINMNSSCGMYFTSFFFWKYQKVDSLQSDASFCRESYENGYKCKENGSILDILQIHSVSYVKFDSWEGGSGFRTTLS